MSAAEANRNFSKLLREVQGGRSYLVTSHGRPVARVIPYEGPSPELVEARKAHLKELMDRPAVDIGPWTRDEIHER